MNFKILSFLAAAVAAVASGQPIRPECTVGEDTEACTTPFGDDGYFVHKVRDEDSASATNLRHFGDGRGWGRGRGRGRGRLSSSKCVPVDAPEEGPGGVLDDVDGTGPFANRHAPVIECGCDGDCPTPISCGCDCDIALPFGAVMGGTKATVTKRDGTPVNKCLPPMYADADAYTCITDCDTEVESRFGF
jgi:hypothetical protein